MPPDSPHASPDGSLVEPSVPCGPEALKRKLKPLLTLWGGVGSGQRFSFLRAPAARRRRLPVSRHGRRGGAAERDPADHVLALALDVDVAGLMPWHDGAGLV